MLRCNVGNEHDRFGGGEERYAPLYGGCEISVKNGMRGSRSSSCFV